MAGGCTEFDMSYSSGEIARRRLDEQRGPIRHCRDCRHARDEHGKLYCTNDVLLSEVDPEEYIRYTRPMIPVEDIRIGLVPEPRGFFARLFDLQPLTHAVLLDCHHWRPQPNHQQKEGEE